MALVQPSEGGDPTGRDAGVRTYNVGGRIVARQVVVPVRPRSPAQQSEVVGVTNAMKFFANHMSPAEQAAVFADAGSGITGLGVFSGIKSSIFEGDVVEPDPEIVVVDASSPPIGSPVFCPAGSSISAALGLPDGWSSGKAWFAVSRPLGRGRQPTLRDTRILARSITLPAIVDVGAAYLSRFGAFPPEGGNAMLAARAVDPASGARSAVGTVIVPVGCAGVDCWVSPDPTTSIWGGPASLTIFADFDDGITTLVNVSLINAGGWVWQGPTQIGNATETTNTIGDGWDWSSPQACTLRFESNETGSVCTRDFVLLVDFS